MFENGIDQSIHTIKNTATNTFIKNRQTFIILFNSIFNRFFGIFCEIRIPPSMKSSIKTSNKQINNFRLIQIMVILIGNTNHGHMTHFINDFLLRQTINIPFIKLISRNRKLCLKNSFFKLHIRRSRF